MRNIELTKSWKIFGFGQRSLIRNRTQTGVTHACHCSLSFISNRADICGSTTNKIEENNGI